MATPRASSSQAQNSGRDARRVWSGAGRGRPGLGPVAGSRQPVAGRGRASTPTGWVFSAGDRLIAHWSGTLTAGTSLDTRSTAYTALDQNDDPNLAFSGSTLQPTTVGLFWVRWSLSLSSGSGDIVSLSPSVSTTVYFTSAESSPAVDSTVSVPLEAGSNIYALLANLGSTGFNYTLQLLAQSIIVP